MKFALSIQQPAADGRGDKYPVVARFTHAEHAIISAQGLAARLQTRIVQVWRIHRGRHAYNVIVLVGAAAYAAQNVADALATHRAKEKKWRDEERTSKARVEAFLVFIRKFAEGDRERLRTDRKWAELSFATPPRFDEAQTRAAEMGIFPTGDTGDAGDGSRVGEDAAVAV